jgi:hypothetical protein
VVAAPRFGNGDVPDVVLEEPGSAANPGTQFWYVVTRPEGGTTLLNMSGGRAAGGIWTGEATAGQREPHRDRRRVLQTAVGPSDGAPLTLENAATDGSQDWRLVE